jgi:hypothetical protein
VVTLPAQHRKRPHAVGAHVAEGVIGSMGSLKRAIV